MSLKRLLASVLAVICIVSVLTTAAYAHGGHHRTASRVNRCELCSVEDCELSGRHVHDGVVYCGYCHEDGWCNGTCAALCEVEDCQLTGRHVHDGVTYCGYGHSDGWCNGSCTAVRTAGCGRGHGRCH